MRQGAFLRWAIAGVCAAALLCGAIALAPNAVGQAGPRGSRPQPAGAWRVLEPVTYENLSVFPVVTRTEVDTSGYVTLDEALASGDAVVTERGGEILRRTRDGRPVPLPGGGAAVNQLVLIHRGSKPLVLLAGEVVSGGKQDRVIAKDRIVPPGAEPLPLDVFCVERGRWSGASAQFAAANLIVHPSVREKAVVEQKQDEVWAAVRSGTTSSAASGVAGGVIGGVARATPPPSARIEEVIASEAPSESYAKIYKSSRLGESVEAFAEEVQRRFARATRELKGERVVGVVIAYGGEVAWADVFASEALFNRYWSKLVRSYAVEALARPSAAGGKERATLDVAREFLEPLKGRETSESEPGVYRWRQIAEGHYAEIVLEALPNGITLHWVKIHRTS